MWLHGRTAHTQTAYRSDLARLRSFVQRPLAAVRLSDLQAFADSLAGLAPSTQARILAGVKSFYAFVHQLDSRTFPYDVGKPLRLPAVKNTIAERILPEAAVHRMMALETNPRNHALMTLLYYTGMRVSEVCNLCWRDVQPRDGGAGQVTVFGKGGKTRTILLPSAVYAELMSLHTECENSDDDAVFLSRTGHGHLSIIWATQIVKKAAVRAGLSSSVSCHWLRHAHASHALDRGAPAHLVMTTLGHSSLTTTSRYMHARPSESSGTYLA
jgi:integrase/recombinase XerD